MKDSLVSTRKVVPSAAACCSAHGAVQPGAGASKAAATPNSWEKNRFKGKRRNGDNQ